MTALSGQRMAEDRDLIDQRMVRCRAWMCANPTRQARSFRRSACVISLNHDTVRSYHDNVERRAKLAGEAQSLREAATLAGDDMAGPLTSLADERAAMMEPQAAQLLDEWPALAGDSADEYVVKIRDREYHAGLASQLRAI